MKNGKALSSIFALLGALLLVGSVILCLTSLDASAKLIGTPKEAASCAEELMEAVAAGDFGAAGNLLYGQPDLGADREPADEAGKLIWNAFTDSISYEFTGECYATNSGLAQDVEVTTLDISSVTEALSEHVHALLTERMETAEEMSELYDEENNFREAVVMEVLLEAVEKALQENAQTVTREVTLNLIYRDGQWWVMPDQALLQAISGGVTG